MTEPSGPPEPPGPSGSSEPSGPPEPAIRIVVADDETLLRDALEAILSLQADIDVAVSYTHLTLPTTPYV